MKNWEFFILIFCFSFIVSFISGCVEVERNECKALSKYELRQEAAE